MMDTQITDNRRGSGDRGFTLVELMVVIVIILVLLGIGIGVGPAMLGMGGERQLTKTALANAQLLYDEYQNLGGAAVATNWDFTTAAIGIRALNRPVAAIPPQIIVQTVVVGRYMIVDGWGNPLALVQPTYYDGTVRDINGNNVTTDAIDTAYNKLPNRSTGGYFASAGPDGQWGDITTAGNIATTDNVYSYNLGGN